MKPVSSLQRRVCSLLLTSPYLKAAALLAATLRNKESTTQYSVFQFGHSSIAMEPMYCMPVEKSAPKTEKSAPRRSFNDTTNPVEHTTLSPTEADPDCRCGCIPKEIMSMFQMAALRKKYQERLRMEAESEALGGETVEPKPSISL